MAEHRRDEEFYERDRPAHPTLAEDRPRGAQPGESVNPGGPWAMVAIVTVVVLLVVLGIALFP
ncbi:hypothetical protein AAW14_05615 [Streptomyces hygroscopicus]|uniref:hypothetical protein n=1 Tax=Streptomyces hygroscopicus TaxID=1912 RepID=UPI00223F6269|nr:hypothetical protein [Streptomyces hygroscopicus]MCW7941541.1 hypothetical protein [Streptomyces hygroscopicus]